MKQQIDTKGLQSIVDGQLALGLKAVEAAEQLGALQLNVTKALLEQSVKQHQALLEQLTGFLQQGDSLGSDLLRAKMLQIALELLDLFVEIRQKSPVFCRQIFFFAV